MLVMEYFTRLLVKVASTPMSRYHHGCKNLKISSLCFTYDLLLFCNRSVHVVQLLLKTFKSFSESTGLVVDQTESSICFTGVSGVCRGKY